MCHILVVGYIRFLGGTTSYLIIILFVSCKTLGGYRGYFSSLWQFSKQQIQWITAVARVFRWFLTGHGRTFFPSIKAFIINTRKSRAHTLTFSIYVSIYVCILVYVVYIMLYHMLYYSTTIMLLLYIITT